MTKIKHVARVRILGGTAWLSVESRGDQAAARFLRHLREQFGGDERLHDAYQAVRRAESRLEGSAPTSEDANVVNSWARVLQVARSVAVAPSPTDFPSDVIFSLGFDQVVEPATE